ncbi:2-amino-4-hydroxy-6-hydroxymethyldihydropteridine diphosphokinase [Brumimicrobium aurantiacum]|uniref:2-amino-4-hydroxy-6-hydroxymethyldihydropteridine pyrophosphokinase n=1 Tax=Brumimicrobium aurantiacum TaxID=1737063 RepID=A0A3E1F0L9_9FLAO|nr:2-amino-4-hydroxy-6-hydroxymethyldihydropteridine diphosphokinase [Brumimicrobium aurantiacum]RFC55372.1 2-amino-4-hydroxy-6-hydroxymethyldihydropteridine diphosphokinase [Brumimicrobium aurantiacum]
MVEVILGLGSNLGDKKSNIENAVYAIETAFDCESKSSRLFRSKAWGFNSDSYFLNSCISIKTSLSPFEVLSITKSIEKQIGRVKKSKNNTYESRVIDIDILYYGDKQITHSELTIPHPHISSRAFVITTIKDLNPEFMDPVNNQSIERMLSVCNDKSSVILYED